MVSPFPRTLRTLGAQSKLGARLLLVASAALLTAWTVWLFSARVPVYVTSDRARVEVTRATYPVEAPLAGRVVRFDVALDDEVRAGDPLVYLDAAPQMDRLAETKTKIDGVDREHDATARQLATEQAALGSYRGELQSTLAEATSRLREAEVSTRAARDEVARDERLVRAGSIAEIELTRARTELDRRTLAEESLGAEVERLRSESSTGAGDRRARMASLETTLARLEAERASLVSTVASLEAEIERRVIRAPSDGRIGEIGDVHVGSVVERGDRIATVMSGGPLRVVAFFDPSASVGRVARGQRARMRLDGFPWTEYGTLDGTVADVAIEVRDGKVRIELAVDEQEKASIPVQHGLQGEVDVTVEEASPASLVLRAAGRIGHRDRTPPPAPPVRKDSHEGESASAGRRAR